MNAAFEDLVKKLSPTLKRISYRLNGHFTFFNDEDLFQEALVHLWQDFQAGKLNDKTDSYILQGCYYHLKNYIRKVQDKARIISMDTLVNKEGQRLEELLPAKEIEPYFEYLNSKFIVEKMQNNGLSRREKEVLSFCLEGLTTREIGKRIGVSHVMVVKLKSRIENKCRKYIDFI